MPTERIRVEFFVTVGKDDTTRVPFARSFYEKAKNLGIKVEFKEYPCGHALPPEQTKDSINFFRNIKRIRG